MGLFSRKKKEQEKEGGIPETLPDTVMQRMSSLQNSQEKINPRGIYTEDIKRSLLAKSYQREDDSHKRIPDDISQQSKDRGPERHEVEQVLMIREQARKKEEESIKQAQQVQQVQAAREHHWPSFFVELERRIIGKKHHLKHIISQDLMSRMKEYHDSAGNGDHFFMHELEIEEEISNSLSSLKDIESDWLFMKKQAAAAEKMLFEKEQELERRLANFKGLLVSAEKFKAINMVAPEGQAFFLSGGTKLYSVQHLANELPNMSDEVFFYHVNSERNDFAAWIQGVFRLEELASRVREAKTKQELLDLLKGN